MRTNTQAKRSDGGDEDTRTKKGRHLEPTTKKVLLHDENDETPRKNDLSALILCNPPALESYPKVVARHWKQKLISVSK